MNEYEREDLVSNLVLYGLTPVQAQIYITLLKLGTSSAKSVTLNSSTNRVDVYRALRKLCKVGLVEQVLGNPVTFAPVEPGQALDVLLEVKSSQVEKLASDRASLRKRLELLAEDGHLSNANDGVHDELFLKVLSGDRVFQKLKSLLMQSQREVIAVFSPKTLILYDRLGIPELERSLMDRGISVRALTSVTKENLKLIDAYSKSVNFRQSDKLSFHLRYTVVDRSYLILPVGDPPASLGEATALWTNSNAVISGLVDDFEKLWLDSKPLVNGSVSKPQAQEAVM